MTGEIAHAAGGPARRLSALTALALLGMGLCFLWGAALAGEFEPDLLGLSAVLFVAAAAARAAPGWGPALGGVLAGGITFAGWLFQPYTAYHLTHPDRLGPFAMTTLSLALGLVASVLGLGATARHHRGHHGGARTRPAPPWVPLFLAAVSGAVVRALLIALVAPSPTATAAATAVAARTATVRAEPLAFDPPAVTVPSGASLTVSGADSRVPHVLANGAWVGGVARPAVEPGAPLVDGARVEGGTARVGPFAVPGRYAIYCTLHPGMNLTVTVG